MQTYKLNTGDDIPAIGFGTWQIYPNGRAQRAVAEALSAGNRLIDTARIYGNERGVAKAINGQSDIPRQDIFITTKLWNSSHGYDETLAAHEKSLKRLSTSYTDLYLIHWPGSGKRQETWRAMGQLFKTGKSKAIGVSNYTIAHLEELMAVSDIIPAVNQIEFHPYLFEEQQELIEFCRQHNILVEAYSPLAHGRKRDDGKLDAIAAKYGKSPAQIILRWCIEHGTIPLPKTTNPDHMRENIDIFDFSLTISEIKQINGLSDGTRTFWNPNRIP